MMYNFFQQHIKTEEQEFMKVGYKKANMFYMSMSGMYPTFTCNSLLSWFYCLFVVAYLIFLFILFMFNICSNWGMIEVMSELILYSSILFAAIGSTVSCLYNRHKINRMLWFIGKGFFIYTEPLSSEQENVFLKTGRMKKYMNIIFSMYVYIGGAVAILLIPFLMLYQQNFDYRASTDETVNKFYPLALNVYFLKSNILHYFVAGNVLQYIGFVILTNTVLGTAVVYYFLVTALIEQLQILALSIKNICNRANMLCNSQMLIKKERQLKDEFFVQSTDFTLHPTVLLQHCLNVCLKSNILHHNILIEYFQCLKEFYSYFLLMILFGASVTTCMSGYHVIVMTSSLDTLGTVRNLIILAGVLTHTFVFCWYGEQLSNESTLIKEALYFCPWYYADEKFKRSAQIIMVRACKQMQLSAAGMMTASLSTFAQVLSTAYSYFNLLRVAKDRIS